MDKYTVDLDKVLNDFEYSEYSLESAKLNRNAHEDLPNTSISSSLVNKNNTPIKHSITNVFHSLNEYLSSDITTKQVENILTHQKNVFIKDSQASNFSETQKIIIDIPKLEIQESMQETPRYNILENNVPNLFPIDHQINNYTILTSDVENTEVIKDELDAISEEISRKIAENDPGNILDCNVADKNIYFKEDIKNKALCTTLEDQNCLKIENEFKYKDESLGNDEISEGIIVAIENNRVFEENKHLENTSKEESNLISEKNYTLALSNNAAVDTDDTSPKTESQILEKSNTLITEDLHEYDTSNIENQIEVKANKADLLEKETEIIKVTVKFENDFQLDEENLDQYFQELEEELGKDLEKVENPNHAITKLFQIVTENIGDISDKSNIPISINKLGEINEVPSVNKEVLEEFKGQDNPTQHTTVDEKYLCSEIEENRCTPETKKNENINEITNVESVDSEIKTDEIPFTEVEICETHSKTSGKEKMTLKDQISQPKKMRTNVAENVDLADESTEKEEKCIIQSSDSAIIDQNIKHTQDESHRETQILEKNFRPQHLLLNKENQEVSRKINLIGDPGSTPYNNVYSTKDFEKNNQKKDGSGESSSVRPVSPTYSDVSTDSVSSATSNEVYSDALPKIEDNKMTKNEKSETQNADRDDSSEEPVPNNMISSKELCKNDVTIDKDFTNNLKTNNSEEMGEFSRSNNVYEQKDTNEKNLEKSSTSIIKPTSDESEVFADSSQSLAETSSDQSRIDESSGSIGIDWLGKQAPLWIPDNEATNCLHCEMKFTVIKRRHHCRACGLVLCAKCCNLKYRLEYLDAEARVCKKCYDILNKDTNSSTGSEVSQESSSPARNITATQVSPGLGQPNPNNPLEYCSTIPPLQQVDLGAVATPSVMVPVGVLKRKGSNKGRSNKSVMFCDGIRPGSDLTNLDTDFNYSDSHKSQKSKKVIEKPGKGGKNADMIDPKTRSFIPSDEKSLPPTVTIYKAAIKYATCSNNCEVVETLKNETLIFALHSNVFVHVKIVNLDCCVNRMVWCFSTDGLINVGQDEIVILLEMMESESSVPKDVFVHINNIYLEAVNGSSVKELGLSLHTSSPFLGSKNHAGFVYIKPSFQCLQNIILPKEPYLIAVLIHRWETPWAKLFPLRLVLRLGAEYKYYPSPIISTRERDSVYVEIGHTIINLLADFRNFSYTLPQIRGLTIHMQDKNTTVTIPTNRYDQVMKGLCNSSDHILAFGGNFSSSADSHLVCIQDTQSATNNYSTHAINICNQPRKVTGASFIVFNGALKSTSGLTAKSNIVEDGLMIQILPEHMLQVRESLRNMKNHIIKCGCVNEESDETVTIVWGEPDTSFNVGVLSPIDNKRMTGIPSIRVHNGKDYTCNSGSRLIRWTEVFILQNGDESSRNQEPVDISKISENIAKATCQALVKYLDLLVSNSFYKIGLRANLHIENVSYSAGSNNVKLPPIYMKSLDNELIPVLHQITSNNITEQPIILELIFRILNI
ncbi:hypothetical protein WA026_002640 [Henosepilachna vigintioctopunctata]|uniref:FYVE-type domain-containing protein n=1 Tax=Henosepilachna vigintioctopunctata TaxID=420089 RepID=A0AAW1U017_9CUCU